MILTWAGAKTRAEYEMWRDQLPLIGTLGPVVHIMRCMCCVVSIYAFTEVLTSNWSDNVGKVGNIE